MGRLGPRDDVTLLGSVGVFLFLPFRFAPVAIHHVVHRHAGHACVDRDMAQREPRIRRFDDQAGKARMVALVLLERRGAQQGRFAQFTHRITTHKCEEYTG